MIICPGGGYHSIEPFRDGSNGAIWFAEKGITCFVLRYRIGTDGYRYPQITADVKRAMRLVRSRAREWGIDTSRIGIAGFSAGGHLAAVASNYFDSGNSAAVNSIERMSSRPAFSMLLMPVITMDARWTYQPGVPNFLGSNPSKSIIDSFSMEKHISARTPVTFLAHDYDDGLVSYLNSMMYRDSCLAHGIPVKFNRVYGCGHGITTTGCPGWADTAMIWLNAIGMLTTSTSARRLSDAPQNNGYALVIDGSDRASARYDVHGRRTGSSARNHAAVRLTQKTFAYPDRQQGKFNGRQNLKKAKYSVASVNHGDRMNLIFNRPFSGILSGIILLLFLSVPAHSIELYFIGNSLTDFSDLPFIVDSLGAHANPPVDFNTRRHVIGNSELASHFTPDCMDPIKARNFDFVILQGYQQPYQDPAGFFAASRRMDDTITASGARTVFYMPWALLHLDPTRSRFDTVAHVYDSIGAELGALVAPAGRAWQTLALPFLKQQFYIDDVHPSRAASYLTACVLFATITGKSPVGNTYNPVSVPFVPPNWGPPSCDSSGPALQRLAWDIANGYNVLDKTAPSAPVNLGIQTTDPYKVQLVWTSGIDAESQILRSRIYRDGQMVGEVAGCQSTFTDSGLKESTLYTYRVTSVNAASLESPQSAPSQITTPVDTKAPAIAWVYAGISVLVGFSEPIEAQTAQDRANYIIDNGVIVRNAVLQADLSSVVLTVATLTPGTTYTLAISNIRDRAKSPNTIAASTKISFEAKPGITKIRFYPRAGLGARMMGGVFEGSNGDKVNGPYLPLYQISAVPPSDQWIEVTPLTNSAINYRYLRYRGGGYCNVAEVEFYSGADKLTGLLYGSAGSYGGGGNDFRKVFDGDIATYFDFVSESGGYAGIETGSSSPAHLPIDQWATSGSGRSVRMRAGLLIFDKAASVVITDAKGTIILQKSLPGPGSLDLRSLLPGVYGVQHKTMGILSRQTILIN